jgi:hypothetical protein
VCSITVQACITLWNSFELNMHVAVMASASMKRSAVMSEEELECLLQSDSEQSLSDSDFDTENELDDHALLDAVGNEGSDEDDDSV